MRVMGLDVGDKRIGVAISDPLGWTAQPHAVIVRTNPAQDFAHLARICHENQVTRIVVGWPLNMNGSIGPRAQLVQGFAEQLSAVTGLAVEFWDERLSTKSAERTLLAADVSRRKRKRVIDKLAAAHILQAYLDSHRRESWFDENHNKL
ncbi:MAG: Holliday junction resolvase RuvX [Syntrophomonadaceae bacterium]|jgi:putative Holliday junction resolvase|nr:Holliday junction resolvase RuvX [Syntrophomonadaceae bacterium]